MVTLLDAQPLHFERLVALNEAVVVETSPMDLVRLTQLHGLACHHRVALVDGEVAAFVLAMRDGAAYENDNFGWFASRLSRFLYVDRIVVGMAFARRGLGRRLYEDLFTTARAQGLERVVCEYNLEPPNQASRAFHARFGFVERGTQWLAGGTKRVSLQVAELTQGFGLPWSAALSASPSSGLSA
jgi:hypothetical protein